MTKHITNIEKFICALVAVAIAVIGILAIVTSTQADDRNKKKEKEEVVAIATEVHITREDGTKSLLELIRRDPTISQIPNRKVSAFFFVVDAQNDFLIVQGTESQPPGFQLAIRPGDTKTFPILKLPVNAETLMSGFMIRTDRVCNFFVRVEFYDD